MNIQPQIWKPMEAPQTSTLPTKPNHPFFYKWHPSNWDFVFMESKAPEKLVSSQHLPEVKAQMDKMNERLKAMKDFIQEFEVRGLDIYNDLRE
jgi:hypothetical protein